MRQCMDVVRTEKPLPRELTMTVVPEVSTALDLFSYNHRNYGKCRPIIIQKIPELFKFSLCS